ncbi:MAG: ThiF family adenylyltransferase [Enterobacteriaceae bacterium]
MAHFQFEGRRASLCREGPCYRCLYPSPAAALPSCAEGGVVGVLPGLCTIQAAEAIKLIVGGESLIGRLLLFDVWQMKQREAAAGEAPDCQYAVSILDSCAHRLRGVLRAET